MKLHKYKNYEEYKNIQEAGNIDKIKYQWAQESEVKKIANYLKEKLPNAKFGICHGTRRGNEQKWFNEVLGIDVLGTEISKTATSFPNTIQWDFHEVKEEWLNDVDFIYSNSLDHSYDPVKCLDSWMSCIKYKQGICILEWGNGHNESSANSLDPFGASIEELKSLILDKYSIIKTIPITKPQKGELILIQHK